VDAESIAGVPAARASVRSRGGAGEGASLITLLPALQRGMPEMLQAVSRALAGVEQEYADVLAEGCADAVAPAEVALSRLVWGAQQTLRARAEGETRDGIAPVEADPGSDVDGLIWALFEELGREQWRRDRPVDRLLSAYQVGGRAAWRHMSAIAVELGVPAEALAALAEQVFALVDRLGSVTITGFVDEQSGSVRTRDRLREELAERLLSDRADRSAVAAAAQRAGWALPSCAAVVLVLADGAEEPPLTHLDPGWLLLRRASGPALVIPDAAAPGARRRLAGALRAVRAVVGPAVPLDRLSESLALAEAALRLRTGDRAAEPGPFFVEEHLDALLVHQDRRLLEALRAHSLEPLAAATPSSRALLEETLRSWLLHMGNQRAVATELHIHPQTVRYRLGRLREVFGPALDDPEVRRRLFLALAWEDVVPPS
jgi:hypothetical protein